MFKLVDALNRGSVSQWDRDVYNVGCKIMFDSFAQFVSLHYALSHRIDTQYWKDITNKMFKDMQNVDVAQLSGFYELAKLKLKSGSHELTGGINCIATGMQFYIYNVLEFVDNPVLKTNTLDLVLKEFDKNVLLFKSKWETEAALAPTLYEYLKTKYNGA